MNIYEKLSKVTEEITAVAKNLNVGYGKSSYKAVGEADVLAAVKVEVTDRFKGLYLIDRMPEELWMEVHDIVQEATIKTFAKKKKCKKAKCCPRRPYK